jgi:hypothetical protein
MRWMLFSFILFNCSYFCWTHWFSISTVDMSIDSRQSKSETKVPSLVLLSERTKYEAISGRVEFSAKEGISEIIANNVLNDERCWVIGAFERLSVATDFFEKLGGLGIKAALTEVVVDQSHDTWVLIPSLGSRKKALKKLRELQAKNIDSYIITRGRLQNAISLGFFKRYQSAVTVQREMKLMGYEAVLEKNIRQAIEYWIRIPVAIDGGLNEKVVSLLKLKPALKFTESLCK